MSEERQQGIAIFKNVLNNKAQVTANQIESQLLEGNSNPAYVGIVLKKFAKIQEIINKNPAIKELIIEETKKYIEGNGKTAELFGAKITVAAGGYWDYSTTHDPYLEEMEKIHKELDTLIKARKKEIEEKAKIWDKENSPTKIQKFGLSSFNLMYDRLPRLEWDEGIEVVETNPPTKKGAETLRYSV